MKQYSCCRKNNNIISLSPIFLNHNVWLLIVSLIGYFSKSWELLIWVDYLFLAFIKSTMIAITLILMILIKGLSEEDKYEGIKVCII